MKKIIYSLVIMIAAGSLFTSCIEPIEPEGILALRNAKAAYYAALGELRRADAKVQEAEAQYRLGLAAVEQARAEIMKAQAEGEKLKNEMQKLLNEAQALSNDELAAQIEAHMIRLADSLELEAAQHEVSLKNQEIALAAAEESLRLALRDIALASKDLTAKEKKQLDSALNMYTKAFKEVVAKQHALDSLQRELVKAQNTWDNEDAEYYDDYKAYLERQIEQEEEAIEYYTAMLAFIPENAELDEWEAAIDAWTKDSLTNAYNEHSLVEEVAAYFVNTIHDGQKDWDAYIQGWIDANGSAPTAPTQPQRDTVAGVDEDGNVVVPLTEDGEVDGTDPIYAYGNEPFVIDLLKDDENGELSALAWNKLVYLLGSYKQVGPADATLNMIDVVAGTPDTLRIIANAGMADLIMGKDGEEINPIKAKIGNTTYTAQYGVYGVQSIAHRTFVIGEKDADTAATGPAYRTAKKNWEDHYDAVMAGLGSYKDFTDAVSAYEEAKKAENDGATAMASAIAALKTEFDKVHNVTNNPIDNFDYNDSLHIFNALVDFAKAREQYLSNYSFTKGKKDWDSTMFRYGTGILAGKALCDSVKFTEMKFQDLRDKLYDMDWTAGNTEYNATGYNHAIANIANQLLGGTFAAALSAATIDTTGFAAAFNNENALYKTYAVDDYTNPSKLTYVSDGSAYVDPNVATKADAVTKARENYIKMFATFWGETSGAGGVFDETVLGVAEETTYLADPTGKTGGKANKTVLINKVNDGTRDKAVNGTKKYNLEYLEKNLKKEKLLGVFTDPVNLVDKAATPTEGLSGVLTSVDPNSNGTEGQFKTALTDSRLLYGSTGTETEFMKYLKAKDAWDASLNQNFAQDLEIIDAWVKAVAAKFEEATKKAGEPNLEEGSQYAQDVINLEHSKKVCEKYDKYMGKLKALVGTKSNGAPKVTNPATLKFNGKYDEVADIYPGFTFSSGSALAFVNATTGKYNSTNLGGDALTKFKEIFPEIAENFKKWKDTLDEINDHKEHAKIVKEALMPAYYAAALAQGYDEWIANQFLSLTSVAPAAPGDYDALMNQYHQLQATYYNTLLGRIRAANNRIYNPAGAGSGYKKDLADLALGIDAKTIAIRNLEEQIEVAEFDLDQALAALEQAEDYYDYILNLILELQSEL